MGCCDNIIKSIIFLCNFIFFLTSIAIIGIGAYIQVNMTKYLDFLGDTYLNTSVILIIIGVAMLIVTFFGCCGACTQNHCMLYTFGTLLALILLSLIGVAITIYVYKDDVKQVVTDGMTKGMQEFGQDQHDGVTETWNVVQHEFKCCGVQTYADWKDTPFGRTSQDVPDSCCLQMNDGCGKGVAGQSEQDAKNTIYTNGCLTTVENYITSNAGAAAGVGAGIAVILALGVIVTCCVARKIKQETDYV